MAAVANRSLESALQQLASAATHVAGGADLRDALQEVAEAAVAATGAELAVVRLVDPVDGQLASAALAAPSRARAAAVEGTRFPLAELGPEEVTDVDGLPEVVRRIAERARLEGVFQVPISVDHAFVGSLELHRAARSFEPAELALARLAASQVALCLYAARSSQSDGGRTGPDALEIAGEALAVAADDETDPARLAVLAAGAWGAAAALLWRAEAEGPLSLLGSTGIEPERAASALAEAGLRSSDGVGLERNPAALPDGYVLSAVVPLGRPALGALQLLFVQPSVPSDADLARLTAFGANAGRALRAADRARATGVELERSLALLSVLRRATAELSLSHTLSTALERIASLLGVQRVAVYLREGDGLQAAAAQGLAGPHPVVAAVLLELALGPGRGRGALVVEDARSDPRLERVRQIVEETGIESILAAPLVAGEEVIGLLAAYPGARRLDAEAGQLDLLAALAGHLAAAVQNARLHEQAKELGARLEEALTAESAERRRLDGLYEVSRSFAQSLSLDETMEAVTRAAVESLGVDAAVLRVPDSRGEAMITQAIHVGNPRVEEAARIMLSRAQVISRSALQRIFARGQPLHLDRAAARALGGSFELLIPFLEKGSTAVVIPVATPDEVLATLSLISLDPAAPIDDETVAAALSLAGQAALAVDNARLYQQQKQFADSMQRSLLPRELPDVAGLEIGIVYESSARMDVGGDLYDYLPLDDGRLALVLGDVTGHGVDAAADMAMAKFVFRSRAREHPEPADFLAHATDVVSGEIGFGKFITLLYLTVDAASGAVAGAAAGHPPPRVLARDGTVSELALAGLALGIEPGQTYRESRSTLAPGDAVVLFTDGVVEARRGPELYGSERLHAFLAAHHDRPPQELAEALVQDCRRFGGGELADDCAVVVLRRT
jgi:serine phosphatase RsbU (regulator of sigma subunit)